MEYRELTPTLAVGPQIEPADVSALAERGVRTLICNRPDGEEAGQPQWDAVRQAAEQAGIETVFLPVDSSTMGPQKAREFGETLAGAEGPVYAYCRTGTRCTMLWSMSRLIDGGNPDEIVSAAAAAGYDVSALADRFRSA